MPFEMKAICYTLLLKNGQMAYLVTSYLYFITVLLEKILAEAVSFIFVN